jgi:hypothetical protein
LLQSEHRTHLQVGRLGLSHFSVMISGHDIARERFITIFIKTMQSISSNCSKLEHCIVKNLVASLETLYKSSPQVAQVPFLVSHTSSFCPSRLVALLCAALHFIYSPLLTTGYFAGLLSLIHVGTGSNLTSLLKPKKNGHE